MHLLSLIAGPDNIAQGSFEFQFIKNKENIGFVPEKYLAEFDHDRILLQKSAQKPSRQIEHAYPNSTLLPKMNKRKRDKKIARKNRKHKPNHQLSHNRENDGLLHSHHKQHKQHNKHKHYEQQDITNMKSQQNNFIKMSNEILDREFDEYAKYIQHNQEQNANTYFKKSREYFGNDIFISTSLGRDGDEIYVRGDEDRRNEHDGGDEEEPFVQSVRSHKGEETILPLEAAPRFDNLVPAVIPAQLGSHAYLPCRIINLGDKSVSNSFRNCQYNSHRYVFYLYTFASIFFCR